MKPALWAAAPIVAALAFGSGVQAASAPSLPDWVVKAGLSNAVPMKGVVTDERAAIEIAHAAWMSGMEGGRKESLAAWNNKMSATLENGIWEVTERKPPVWGGTFVFLTKQDGRILTMFVTVGRGH